MNLPAELPDRKFSLVFEKALRLWLPNVGYAAYCIDLEH
jgi:hypothetical protein